MSQKILAELLARIPAEYKNSTKPLFIVGPTASGKTALSLALAQTGKAAVISADSRQIYCGLDICTGKEAPRPKPYPSNFRRLPYQIQGIDHYLLDIITPDQPYTMFDFKTDCQSLITQLTSQGIRPIIAGGTGLYVDAVVNNYQLQTPHNISEDKQIRAAIEAEYQKLAQQISPEHAKLSLYAQLKQIDPLSASQLHASDKHGVQRALEFAKLTQSSKASSTAKSAAQFEYLMIYLKPDRKRLYARIDARVVAMFEQGLLAETKALLKQYPQQLKSLSSIGYQQVIALLQGRLSEAEAREHMQRLTRNYAKRQYTWFKRYEPEPYCLTLEYAA